MLGNRNDNVDLAVWMLVILALILPMGWALDPDSCDAHVTSLLGRQRKLAASVLCAVHFNIGAPAFLKTELDVPAKVIVVWVAGSILGVQFGLELVAWCTVDSMRPDKVPAPFCRLTGSVLPQKTLCTGLPVSLHWDGC